MFIKYFVAKWMVLIFTLSLLLSCGGGTTTTSSDNSVPVQPPAAPAAPSLTAGNAQIQASWTAVSGATAYEVWFGASSNSASAGQFSGDVSGASVTITSLTNGTPYYVWLKAKNTVGTSGFSPSSSATPQAASVALVPVIYDDFSDGKLTARTGTDPWGRPLPNWTVSGTWNASAGEAKSDSGKISLAPGNVTKGTWKLRYHYVNAPPTSNYNQGSIFTFITNANESTLYLNNPTDGHWWLDYWAKGELGGSWPRASHSYPYINMVGSQIGGSLVADTGWHDVVFIRDDLGYVGTWLDGTFVQWSRDINTEITANTLFSIEAYGLAGYTLAVDNIEIYDDVFLIPNKGISYASASGLITVNDYDVTPQQIALAVNDPAVFSYDSATSTATCYADILIKSGAKFKIINDTLRMTGGKRIMYEREAMIFLDGATILSTNTTPWNFQISGPTAYGAVVFSVVNSTLDNFGGFSATAPKCLYLKDSRFTNLVGTYPFNIAFRRPANAELLVKGCLFQGKTGAETILLTGGDQFSQLLPEPVGIDFLDCRFQNITFYYQYDPPYYLSPGRPGGTANAINTSFDKLTFNGTTLRHKYYLDVLVLDSAGQPVQGATVTVLNEQDDIKHPAENLKRGLKWLMVGDQVSVGGEDYFSGQQGNWFKGWDNVNDYRTATTGADGHTPPPSDTAGTLVITDRVDMTGNPTYTYTVTATKGPLTGQITALDPDATWYRENPLVPASTVVLTIN